MTFGGRQPSVEDNLRWKTTFGGRQPLVEDSHQGKTPFGGRRPSVEGDLPWRTTLVDPCMPPSMLCGFFCRRMCFANFRALCMGPSALLLEEKKMLFLTHPGFHSHVI